MRNYSIELRRESDFYMGKDVSDRVYPKMTSSEADGERGTIKLRIGREAIELTPAEAQDIGQSIMNAGDGASDTPPPVREFTMCALVSETESAVLVEIGRKDRWIERTKIETMEPVRDPTGKQVTSRRITGAPVVISIKDMPVYLIRERA